MSLNERHGTRNRIGFPQVCFVCCIFDAFIYLVSHAGKQLLVYDEEKRIKAFIPLDKSLFKQPEGICFSPEGTLFISNESQGGRGNILTFKPTK